MGSLSGELRRVEHNLVDDVAICFEQDDCKLVLKVVVRTSVVRYGAT
ncbi:hypothetical protein ACFSBX_15245 [Halobellus rarus]|uniref:Uncharacterized protein n=1 Tax=Halobellus rarus TaxID=1126237 RepID=A0ABD6CQE0_9EURY